MEPDAQADAIQDTGNATDVADTTEQPTSISAIVISEDTRLNIREQPNTDAGVIVKVDPGDVLDALAINLSGEWIQVPVSGMA